jgi:nucleotide-binding universal stress UspA family protein
MAFKTIVSVVTKLAVDQPALLAALQLAHRDDGHLETLCLGVDRTQPGYYYAGASPLAMQSNLAEIEADTNALEEAVKKLLSKGDARWGSRTLATQLPGLTQFLAHCMRFADVAVQAKPYGDGRDHLNEVIVEAALFDANIPVLVIPDKAELPQKINRIVVAWNESPEALNAVRRALPLLKSAEIVNIVMIAPPSHAPDRSDPGGALAKMLSRHGIMTEVSILAKSMPRVSDVIARHISDRNADLLVMGAYGHSRIRESILGGATRHTLEMAELPVFMAH